MIVSFAYEVNRRRVLECLWILRNVAALIES